MNYDGTELEGTHESTMSEIGRAIELRRELWRAHIARLQRVIDEGRDMSLPEGEVPVPTPERVTSLPVNSKLVKRLPVKRKKPRRRER